MIGYRDKVWCEEHTCVNRHTCDRFLTELDKNKATDWWGNANYPIIMYMEPKELPCYTMG